MNAVAKILRRFKAFDEKHGQDRDYVVLAVASDAVPDPRVDQEFSHDGVYTTSPVPASAPTLKSSISEGA